MRRIAVVISLSIARAATAGPLEDARGVDQSPSQLLIRTNRGGDWQPPPSAQPLSLKAQAAARRARAEAIDALTDPFTVSAATVRARTEAMDSTAALMDVDGPEDVVAIFRTIRSRHDVMRACYEDAFIRHPDRAGTIQVDFTIAPSGRIARFVIETDTVADSKIAGCFTEGSRAWRFPRQAKQTQFLYVFRWPSVTAAGSSR